MAVGPGEVHSELLSYLAHVNASLFLPLPMTGLLIFDFFTTHFLPQLQWPGFLCLSINPIWCFFFKCLLQPFLKHSIFFLSPNYGVTNAPGHPSLFRHHFLGQRSNHRVAIHLLHFNFTYFGVSCVLWDPKRMAGFIDSCILKVILCHIWDFSIDLSNNLCINFHLLHSCVLSFDDTSWQFCNYYPIYSIQVNSLHTCLWLFLLIWTVILLLYTQLTDRYLSSPV